MLDRMLTPWGRGIFYVLCFPVWGYWVWQTFADTGIPHQINAAQTTIIGDGYYPTLTFALMMFPAMAVSFPFGLLRDFLWKAGIFAPRSGGNLEPPVNRS